VLLCDGANCLPDIKRQPDPFDQPLAPKPLPSDCQRQIGGQVSLIHWSAPFEKIDSLRHSWKGWACEGTNVRPICLPLGIIWGAQSTRNPDMVGEVWVVSQGCAANLHQTAAQVLKIKQFSGVFGVFFCVEK
jgi:hypothetical protein